MSNRKRQKVIKDFSELKPIDERIQMLAVGICHLVFKGEANTDFQPEKGSQMYRQWKMNKFTARQQIAWREFMDDVLLSAGKSGGTVSAYGEYTDKSETNDFKVPTAFENSHRRRLARLFEYIDRREYALLAELTQDTLHGKSSLQIETIGLIRSGYTDKVSARAAGVVHIQNLMDRLADFYGV